MIKSFQHKGLEKLFIDDNSSGINSEHLGKVQNILTAINVAESVENLRLPGFKLHQLKGFRKDTWAITVRANWRITFKFENGNAYVLNYEDYH